MDLPSIIDGLARLGGPAADVLGDLETDAARLEGLRILCGTGIALALLGLIAFVGVVVGPKMIAHRTRRLKMELAHREQMLRLKKRLSVSGALGPRLGHRSRAARRRKKEPTPRHREWDDGQ